MYIYDTYDKTPQRDLGLASSAVEWNKDTRYLSGAFWFEILLSPSTAFAVEIPVWWVVVIMELLD